MTLEMNFAENDQRLDVNFGEFQGFSDGGYDRGYEEGYEVGYNKGYAEGERDGYGKGFTDGKGEGYVIGQAEGYSRGLAEGTETGYKNGYTDGLNQGHEEGYTDGYNVGYTDGYNTAKAEEEIFFSAYGVMYKRDTVITTASQNGFQNSAYRGADKMETLEVPNLISEWTAIGYVFRECTALKTASLPKIKRIGAGFFYDDTALEEVTLGCAEVPMVESTANSFRNCSALKRMNIVGAITTSHGYADSPQLDDVSCENIANSLADLTGKTAQTITVHATVGAKMVAMGLDVIIRNKNWTLVY